MKVLGKVLDRFEEWCIVLFFAFMVLMNFANVLSRYALNMSISAAEELIICIFVWMSMFGTAAAYKRFSHFAMGLIAENVSPKIRKYIGLFSTFCTLLMMLILFYYCFDMLSSQITSGQRTAALRMPVYYQGLAIPIGCVLISIRAIQAGIIDYKKWHSKQNEQMPNAGR